MKVDAVLPRRPSAMQESVNPSRAPAWLVRDYDRARELHACSRGAGLPLPSLLDLDSCMTAATTIVLLISFTHDYTTLLDAFP